MSDIKNRLQIAALPGGAFLVAALQAIVDAQSAQPMRVGKVNIWSGQGTPTGALAGSVGDLYLRSDGGTSTTLYVKESGAGTLTGWVAK